MCIRASEESLSCAANAIFWPQKTADILSYPQQQRAIQNRRSNAYLHVLLEEKDPRSTPWQEPIIGYCKQPVGQQEFRILYNT